MPLFETIAFLWTGMLMGLIFSAVWGAPAATWAALGGIAFMVAVAGFLLVAVVRNPERRF